jgi:hypothetical protein
MGEIVMLTRRIFAAGLAVAVGMGCASAALAPAAMAASGATPAATGSFSTWRAAQDAAGFQLIRPTRLHGLTRSGHIQVTRCEVTGELKKRDVLASYGSSRHRELNLEQNNSGEPCGNFGEAKDLGTFRVHGVRATLFGACGIMGEPSCGKRDIFLFLTWKKGGISYQAASHDELRSTLVNFARSTRNVG